MGGSTRRVAVGVLRHDARQLLLELRYSGHAVLLDGRVDLDDRARGRVVAGEDVLVLLERLAGVLAVDLRLAEVVPQGVEGLLRGALLLGRARRGVLLLRGRVEAHVRANAVARGARLRRNRRRQRPHAQRLGRDRGGGLGRARDDGADHVHELRGNVRRAGDALDGAGQRLDGHLRAADAGRRRRLCRGRRAGGRLGGLELLHVGRLAGRGRGALAAAAAV
mmetsp:Transcript_16595/g.64806  ORF Transcript_16595/g.64806 Transcript_16595/m.64806 type:complete len:222 (-) Transcript_16595:1560-2225(-)